MSSRRKDAKATEVTPARTEARDQYHHGDLKNALIEAAEQLLEEKGTTEFSLRECARRVGVSPTAVLHHFGNALGLVVAVATVSFVEFSSRLKTAADRATAAGADRLEAICNAYLTFAEQKPARYRLMFSDDISDKSSDEYMAASHGAFQILLDALATGRHKGSKEQPTKADWENALFVWSSLHGFATLERTSKLGILRAPLDSKSAKDLRKTFVSVLVRRLRSGVS